VKVAGVLLAAGAGRRMGGPKALLRDRDGVAFLDRALRTMLDGGCTRVTVVLGAAAPAARRLLEEDGWVPAADSLPVGVAGVARPVVDVVVAEDWDEGMGASLRAGLTALLGGDADAALVTLVDLPDVHGPVLRRVLEVGVPTGAGALVRATYGGRPGHPVLIGREHWDAVVSSAHGDQVARDYLRRHAAVPCECGDLATGRDLDRPQDL
jgi:molybdenum cofactor cytidylyltransferase/nicotine blue oxidoreductase